MCHTTHNKEKTRGQLPTQGVFWPQQPPRGRQNELDFYGITYDLLSRIANSAHYMHPLSSHGLGSMTENNDMMAI